MEIYDLVESPTHGVLLEGEDEEHNFRVWAIQQSVPLCTITHSARFVNRLVRS